MRMLRLRFWEGGREGVEVLYDRDDDDDESGDVGVVYEYECVLDV